MGRRLGRGLRARARTDRATATSATLYFREAAGRDTDEFYANPDVGEFWTGPRPSLAHVAADLGLETLALPAFAGVLDAVDADTLVVRDGDRDITDQVDGRRLLAADTERLENDGDSELARDLSELRLVKDTFEIAEMRAAVAATKVGFDDVIGDLSRHRRARAWRAARRGHVQSQGTGGWQHRRIRHDRGIGTARLHPALDPQ